MFFAPFFRRSRGGVDLTLVPGSRRESVVDACIQKLSTLSTLTNDFGFTKRIAYVESMFASSDNAQNNRGGIWQVKFAVIYLV